MYIKVIFNIKEDNYTFIKPEGTSLDKIREYFIGNFFDVGSSRKRIRKCIDIQYTDNYNNAILKKIEERLSLLDDKLFEYRKRENEVFNNLGFGAGMRRSTIKVSSTKTDNVRYKIAELEKKKNKLLMILD